MNVIRFEYAQAVENGDGTLVVWKSLRVPADLEEGYLLVRRTVSDWQEVTP